MKSIRPVVMSFMAGAAILAAGAAQAEVNVGVTLGYPGGYGIPQPAYVAPRPVYVQPAPVYVQRQGYAYPSWREREREREWREHRDYRGYGNNDHHDGDHHDHDRGEHRDGRDGWHR